jgi:hypothetical protein
MVSRLITMDTNERILEQLISSNRRAIRYHVALAIALFVAGLVVAAYTLAVSDIPTVVSGIAGAFTSSLSTLQIKEILSRREKTEVILTIKSRYQTLAKPTNTASKEERKRLLQLMTQIVEKAALG